MAMELHEALSQIAEIRSQMARTEVFRGYRALPVAFSGVLAIAGSLAQAAWITDPIERLGAYLTLWVGAAVLSALAAGAAMLDRRRRSASAWGREATRLALDLFTPSVVAGGLVTAVVVFAAPEGVWALPGLWQVLFSLGLFASCRLLPRPIWFVAVFYLASGVTCLGLARGESALSPWAMGVPFGVGQLLASAILYWTLERGDAPEA
jgi:hypothetical protein